MPFSLGSGCEVQRAEPADPLCLFDAAHLLDDSGGQCR